MSHQAHVDADRAHGDAIARPSWATLGNALLAISTVSVGLVAAGLPWGLSKLDTMNTNIIEHTEILKAHTEMMREIKDDMKTRVTMPEVELKIRELTPILPRTALATTNHLTEIDP